MGYRLSIAVILIFLSAGPALAGPPLLTDDTGTPGNRHWEINLGFTLDSRHDETTYQAPNLDLNYGVGDSIQIKYEFPLLIRHERGEGTQAGLGNSVAGVKWRFLDQERFGINMSVYPQLEFNPPTSSVDRGLVDKGTNLFLPVQVSKKMGPVWVNGEFGYTFKEYVEDEWVYGISSGYEIRDNLSLLGEIHGEAKKDFGKHEVVFNIGTQWDFTKIFGLLASVGRSFRSGVSGQPNLLMFLGLQMRL